MQNTMTKITIFSGFLGAGKTTLIQKLIREGYVGEKLVLIENEFGEIGIDGGFLQDAGVEITEMNSGCICCSLVGDFGKALEKVLEQYHPDRILIEPSGVGKLSDVIRAVQNIHAHDVELDGFTTVVDAKKCKMYQKNFGEFFNNQITYASCLILSHTAGLSQDKLDDCVRRLRTCNEKAPIVTTDWDLLTGKQLVEAMTQKNTLDDELQELLAEAAEHDHHHRHEHDDHDHEHEHEHHHHDHEEHDENCTCGCHDHDHDHDAEEETEVDEHVWLSLRRAQLACAAMRDALCQADPSHAEAYQANYTAYAGQLQALDAEYQTMTETAERSTIVVADRFPFRYLAEDYGLTYYAAFPGCSAETEASFETIVFLSDKVKSLGLPCVLTMEGSNHSLAKTILENACTDGSILTLQSLQAVSQSEIDQGATYLSKMQENYSCLLYTSPSPRD